jgi:RhtB (resistance to homoserine/threonine) family protein
MDYQLVNYLPQILAVISIAIFMAISPGTDFVMITRNTLLYGRKSGIYSALGISVAIWLHVAYCIAGLAVIISSSIVLFSIIKYLAAIYLIYIGIKSFKSNKNVDFQVPNEKIEISNLKSFQIGFFANALNPKTTIFFLSIFTQFVSVDTPIFVQIIFGVIISLAHLLWFSILAMFLSHPVLLRKFENYKSKIEKVIGSILIALGLKVATSSI